MGTRIGSAPDERQWRRIWYEKKATALYALIGLAIGLIGLAMMGWQSRNGSGQDSTTELAAERVLIGESVADLRSMNGVRALRYEEQTIALSRFSGIWGVGMARVIERNTRAGDALMDGVTLQNDPEGWRGVVEIHKTVEGKVSVVGFVEEGSVARLLDESRAVGSVYFYHEPVREDLVPVAIPASRVVAWDYREPHEFSEIMIDEQGGLSLLD